MNVKKLKIYGCFEFTFFSSKDSRGQLYRTFCKEQIKKNTKKNFISCQESIAINKKINTLRGMHMQPIKVSEAKIVRVVNGSVFDVVIDLRKNSPTYLKSISIVLDAKKINAVFIPPGCLHGYLTLKKNTILYYIMNQNYKGKTIKINYLDPKFKIKWPTKKNIIISKEDKNAPNWQQN